ncbi:Vegetative incompatibility protein HET-E-1 [Cladobotryum mycophilum]|uniref:Vegetative incompatibility protein HET-E-1 n=1 Tax=Cladobotryum mycophilum TaxID=491253 RepID=A0ABR0T018_9HYPO
MTSSRNISQNTFGNFTRVHQGDVYNTFAINQDGKNTDKIYLRDLSATDPQLDKKRILEAKGSLLYESYCWILRHPEFQRWRLIKTGILWIKGDPGKGKTMLICGIIEEIEINQYAENGYAYFFCQATDSRINTATAILGGLLLSLIRQKPSLISYLKERHITPGQPLFEGLNSWVALSEMFEAMIQDPISLGIILIVDALDECGTDRDKLLKLVVRTSNRIKWLLSSRNHKDFKRGLESKQSVVLLNLELKENAEEVSQAVNTYIDHCISDIDIIKDDEELKDQVRETLKRKANGTFLWIALVIEQLRKAMEWEIEELLEEVPEGLYNLYDLMMDQIEKQAKKRRDLCLKLLSVITTAYQPLHLDELAALWEAELEGPQGQKHLREIVQLCGSFLTLREETVYFIHQSAKDFMLERGPGAGVIIRHYFLFKSSLAIMSKTLRRNIYSLASSSIEKDEIIPPFPDPLICIRYQCIHWANHLSEANEEERKIDLQDDGCIYTFLKSVYLYWLEAVSLLRSVDQAVTALHTIHAIITVTDSSQLGNLVKDAIRFLQVNRGLVETLPLQLYSSALAFTPEKSIIRQEFLSATKVVPLVLNMPKSWGPYVQIMHGHRDKINTVVFSPDSQFLASGSLDGTARVWTTKTGNCQHILSHGELVNSIALSLDFMFLASGGEKTVRLWKLDTGEELYRLHGHQSSILSVAFTSNSALLASNAADRTARKDIAYMEMREHDVPQSPSLLTQHS